MDPQRIDMKASTVSRCIGLVLTVLMLAGCGKVDRAKNDSDAAPKSGGTLFYAKSGSAVTLDPAWTSETESTIPCDNIFDGLVSLRLGTTGISPALASSWEVSKDGLEYTFHLRQGVKFHDDTPFNAAAVLFSFNRQRDRKHPFYKNAAKFEYWKVFSMDKTIKDILALNDSTVKFILHQPNATFLYILSMEFVAIVSPTAMAKWDQEFTRHPVGTGAFRFVDWEENGTLTIEANPDYWDGRPHLDKVVFVSAMQASDRVSKLLSGEFDMIESPGPERMQELESNAKIKFFKQPGVNIAYLAMNMNKKPFDDIRVRKAIVYGINREKLVQEVYGEFGRPAKNPIPPMLLGYNDDIRPTSYDPAASKKLLSEAGLSEGFKTKLWTMSLSREYLPDGMKAAKLIQADLKEIGIETDIVTDDWKNYLDRIYHGEHELALMGWIADIPDPDNFFFPLLDKSVAESTPSDNIAFYKGEDMHEKLLKGKVVSDQVERGKIYKDACAIFNRDLPWFIIAHSVVIVPMQSYVMNFQPYASYARKFNKVWLNK